MLSKIKIYIIIFIISISIIVILYFKKSKSSINTQKNIEPPLEIPLIPEFFVNIQKIFKEKSGINGIKHLKCNNTNKCISFGPDKKRLNTFFEFTTFKYLINPQKIIGNPSVNGFATLFNYKRDDFESTAILKTSISKDSDNLFYEYIVGKVYINEQLKFFPCFVETYSVYINDILYLQNERKRTPLLKHILEINRLKNKLIKQGKNDNSDIRYNDILLSIKDKIYNLSDDIKQKFKNISNTTLENTTSITETCSNSDKLSILIDTVPSSISLYYYMENNITEPDFLYTLINILFQIYSVLSVLQDEFTHYDLHTNNVLLYEVENNGYITMNYTPKDGKIISFDTKYIAKIIDYGRSIYKISNPQNVDSPLNSSTLFYNKIISKIPECVNVYKKSQLLHLNDNSQDLAPLLTDVKKILTILSNVDNPLSFDSTFDRSDISNIWAQKYFESAKYDKRLLDPSINRWVKNLNIFDNTLNSINNVTDAYEYMSKELVKISKPMYNNKKGTMDISLDRTKFLKFY